ncbi:hypothetical protein BsWGS_08788 [Bradybaena similaris]
MFAKLKKKIENEGVVASPETPGRTTSRRDSASSLPRAGSIQHLGPSPPGSVTSDSVSMHDVSSAKDEMASLLQRKSEQCKKLEGNISDLAALIKDKSKIIEKLEMALRQQEDITNRKLQEQKEEFEKYRDKLIEGYQHDKLQLDKLINTEETLVSCRSDLEAKTRQCLAAQSQVERLTDELVPLRQKLTALESEIGRLKEENTERAELITSLSRDKAAFNKRLDEMNTEMTEKHAYISQTQAQLAALDGEHRTLVRNSDLQRNKTSKLLQEKDDQIDTLRDQIKTLEQRITDSSLSGDDRLTAVHQERVCMEQKLAEARLQLTEVKLTWSDKITQLEDQISHLNAKIVEDSEEYAASQKMSDQMKESFQKQIADLRDKLEDAEQRALENLELASSKDTHYEKKITEIERELNQQKLAAAEDEEQLKARITSLEAQVNDLEMGRKLGEEEAKSKLVQMEEQAACLAVQKTNLEADVRNLEDRLIVLQTELTDKDGEIKTLSQQIHRWEKTSADQTKTIAALQQKVADLTQEVDEVTRARDEFERHLRLSEGEKGDLLERNADLLKQLQSVKSSNSASKLELQKMVELRSQTIESMRKSETALRQRLESLEHTIEQNEISKAESGLYSDRIDEMNKTIFSLQTQLTEKTRVVKKQDQTLKDLRMTLQRELKIQSLPNDETFDLTANNTSSTSPVMSRKYGSDSRLCPKHQDLQQYPPHQYSQQQTSSQISLQMSNSMLDSSSAASSSPAASSGMVPPPAVGSPSAPSGATDALTAHTASVKRDLNKDVNFLYLKHVVLKFMLSRESEAIQLIKAVSMLLNFTHQEQQLIRETLQWKMSWFGHRPPVGKGQTSKIIPPTL